MQVVNYSKTRENLAKVIDEVIDKNETVIITKNNKSVVMISLEEYNYLQGKTMDAYHKVNTKYSNVLQKLAK